MRQREGKGRWGVSRKMIQGYNLYACQKLAAKQFGAAWIHIKWRCPLCYIVIIRTHARYFVCLTNK